MGVDKYGAPSMSIPTHGVVWVFGGTSTAGVSLENYMLIASHATLTGIAGNPAEGKTITLTGWLPCPF